MAAEDGWAAPDAWAGTESERIASKEYVDRERVAFSKEKLIGLEDEWSFRSFFAEFMHHPGETGCFFGDGGWISEGRIPPHPISADPLRIGAETRSGLMAKQVTVISPLLH